MSLLNLVIELNPLSLVRDFAREKRWDYCENKLKECFKISYCFNGRYSFSERVDAGIKSKILKHKLEGFALKWREVESLEDWKQEYGVFEEAQGEIWKEYWDNK